MTLLMPDPNRLVTDLSVHQFVLEATAPSSYAVIFTFAIHYKLRLVYWSNMWLESQTNWRVSWRLR